jgi:hypothetical protein
LEFSTTQREALGSLAIQFLGRGERNTGPFDESFGVGVLLEQRPPSAADRERMAAIAQERAARGTSLDQVLAAIDEGQGRIWGECGSLASAMKDGAAMLSAVGGLLMGWHGAATAAAVETFRRLEQTGRISDRDRRAGQLHGVLVGGVDPATIPELAGDDGPPSQWRALRARPIAPATTTLLERTLASAVDRNDGIVAAIAGDVYGIVAARPRIRREMAYVALGPEGEAHALPASFVTATRVLEASQALDARGVTAMEDLRLGLAVVEAEGVGYEVMCRCLDPLTGMGSFGGVLRVTLATYLEHGARVDPTAAALGVHPNTIRHRLRRYEEATGLDLARTDDVVELWWALRRDGLANGTGAPAP